jgi:hypothetical protein
MTQSTGHASVLQAVSLICVGQLSAPNAGLRNTDLNSVVTPPPHDLLQMVGLDHSDMLQAREHGCVLHAASSSAWPHSAPPRAAGVSSLRTRFL